MAISEQNLILAAVAGHLLLTVLHGFVHAAIRVFPTSWEAAFAAVFLYLLPVTGAGLTVRGRQRAGGMLLLSAGVAGLAFEGVLHFLVANPDHIAYVPDHRTAFGLTAVLTTASNFLLLGAGCLSERLVNDSSTTIED